MSCDYGQAGTIEGSLTDQIFANEANMGFEGDGYTERNEPIEDDDV